MKQILINFLNRFRTKGDEERHFLSIKGKHLSWDKQRHGALALFISILTFSYFIESTDINDFGSAFLGGVLVGIIGYLIELSHLLKKNRNYSNIDWITMLLFGWLGCYIMVVIRLFLDH